MKRNRLNHFADAIIGILTGYQVLIDYQNFKKKGPGTYTIDLLNEKVTFNGAEIDIFPVFSYIIDWFRNETENNTNPKANLTTAKVLFRVENKTESTPYYQEFKLFRFTLFRKKFTTYQYNTEIDVILKTQTDDYSKKGEGVIF